MNGGVSFLKLLLINYVFVGSGLTDGAAIPSPSKIIIIILIIIKVTNNIP